MTASVAHDWHDHEAAQENGELHDPFVTYPRRPDPAGSELDHVDEPDHERGHEERGDNSSVVGSQESKGRRDEKTQRADLDRRIVRVEVQTTRQRRVEVMTPEEELDSPRRHNPSPCQCH